MKGVTYDNHLLASLGTGRASTTTAATSAATTTSGAAPSAGRTTTATYFAVRSVRLIVQRFSQGAKIREVCSRVHGAFGASNGSACYSVHFGR